MRNTFTSLALVGAGLIGALAVPAGALAVDTAGTADITGGSLTMVAPPTVAFSATLNGVDQVVNASQAISVLDQTGSSAGWNITGTSTTFTSGTHTLPSTAVTIRTEPTADCAGVDACTQADTDVAYPYTLPADTVAPTATKLYNAIVDSGLGNQVVTLPMSLAVPANAVAGNYTSTWTYSLTSAP